MAETAARSAPERVSPEPVLLTQRQFSAVMIAIRGDSTRDCAARFGTNPQAFKNCLRRVYELTGAENRTQLAFRVLTGRLNLQVGAPRRTRKDTHV